MVGLPREERVCRVAYAVGIHSRLLMRYGTLLSAQPRRERVEAKWLASGAVGEVEPIGVDLKVALAYPIRRTALASSSLLAPLTPQEGSKLTLSPSARLLNPSPSTAA
jgi:hypothetical protein